MNETRRQEMAEALLELGAEVERVLEELGSARWHAPERRVLLGVAARLRLLGLELVEEGAREAQEIVR